MKLNWWLRLRWWEWLNKWRAQPFARSAHLLSWFLPCVALPLALLFRQRGESAAVFDWLLSFDVPLALLLSAVVAASAAPLAAGAEGRNEDLWLAGIARQRLLPVLQWSRRLLHAGRWVCAFALLGLLLNLGARNSAMLAEWLMISALALLVGATLARVRVPLAGDEKNAWIGSSRSTGLRALSWVPLRAAWRHLDPRRLAVLGLPVLLAAPMGVVAGKVALALSVWLPLAYAGICCREAGTARSALRRWLPRSPRNLDWWLWRYVVLLLLGCAAALAVVWKGALLSARTSPA